MQHDSDIYVVKEDSENYPSDVAITSVKTASIVLSIQDGEIEAVLASNRSTSIPLLELVLSDVTYSQTGNVFNEKAKKKQGSQFKTAVNSTDYLLRTLEQ